MKRKEVREEDCVYQPFQMKSNETECHVGNTKEWSAPVNRLECPPMTFDFFVNDKPVPKTEGRHIPEDSVYALFKPVQRKRGLFRFKVWVNGVLEECDLVQTRGKGGKFIHNNTGECAGILVKTCSAVLVKQDGEGKLYAI